MQLKNEIYKGPIVSLNKSQFSEILWQFDGCRFVDVLLSSMSDAELSELERSELYWRSAALSSAVQSRSKNLLMENSIVMELHKIPKQHISK